MAAGGSDDGGLSSLGLDNMMIGVGRQGGDFTVWKPPSDHGPKIITEFSIALQMV